MQFNRDERINYIYAAFAQVIDAYRTSIHRMPPCRWHCQGGGDGRIVGECIGRYQTQHPEARFHAIITANGFEDEQAPPHQRAWDRGTVQDRLLRSQPDGTLAVPAQ